MSKGDNGKTPRTSDVTDATVLRESSGQAVEETGKDSTAGLAARSVADLDGTLARLGGDGELLRELLEVLRRHSPECLANIRAAITREDAVTVERFAHRLKGSFDVLGLERAATVAATLERSATAGAADELARLFAQLEAEYGAAEIALGGIAN